VFFRENYIIAQKGEMEKTSDLTYATMINQRNK